MKRVEEDQELHESRMRLQPQGQVFAEFPLEPLDDRVIVRLIEGAERVTKGGIRLPKTTEVPQRGIVVAVGPGASLGTELTVQDIRRPLRVKVGDVVYFARYAGVELKVDEEDYLALRERDVIAIDRRPPRPVTAPAAVDGARTEP